MHNDRCKTPVVVRLEQFQATHRMEFSQYSKEPQTPKVEPIELPKLLKLSLYSLCKQLACPIRVFSSALCLIDKTWNQWNYYKLH